MASESPANQPEFKSTAGNVSIRHFQAGDEAEIWSVFYEAVHQTAAANYTEAQINAWASKETDPVIWARHIQKIRPFVAEVEQQIVAYADLQTYGLIDHFFVSPLFNRQGVGSLLMKQIHQKAAQQNIHELYSHVSITAKTFFAYWGFEVQQEQTVMRKGVQMNNFLMRKILRLPEA